MSEPVDRVPRDCSAGGSNWRRSPDCAGESSSTRCRTFRGRMELASRIFVSLAFLAGGIGGAIGLGGAAWFLLSQGNCGVARHACSGRCFFSGSSFPLMATAFTQNRRVCESSAFPAELPVVLSDPPGLRLAGSGNGRGQSVAARNRSSASESPSPRASLGHDRALHFCAGESGAGANAVRLAGTLAGPAANPRNHGDAFLSLYSELSADRSVDHCLRTSSPYPKHKLLGQKLSNAQRPLPPGLAAAAIAGMMRDSTGPACLPFLAAGCYGIAFLWLLNFRLRAEYRGENLSESARRKACPAGFLHSIPAGICRDFRAGDCRLRKRVALSQPQRAHAVHSDRAVVHAAGLSKFRAE